MALQQEPFRPYHEGGKVRDSFTVNLNKEERAILELMKKKLEQKKDSTAIKQLMVVAAKYLQCDLVAPILGLVLDNRRKNARLGIVDFEGEDFAKES